MSRLSDLVHFYALLDRLKQRVGGTRVLASFEGFRDWPERGVYFFFEPTEARNEGGVGPRVVRVGTHALGTGSRSTLRQRLGQHRGGNTGGGNHRGSIFRLLVGQALLARGGLPPCLSWGVKGDAAKAREALGIDRQTLTAAEAPVEKAAATSAQCRSCGSTSTTSRVPAACAVLSRAMRLRCSATMHAHHLITHRLVGWVIPRIDLGCAARASGTSDKSRRHTIRTFSMSWKS